MPERTLPTAVAFLVFNRPETTARVWEAIRQARPARLLVIADGPRADRPTDAERCAQVRVICEQVDWPCDVLRNYAETNLGCRRRVSSGLDWVFQTVEEAIVLEDDCLPHPTFFPYCQELLERYRDDERVMMISGDNFQSGPPRTDCSYYFSRYPHIWGWASWRRAWRHYDVDMALWPLVRDGQWLNVMHDDRQEVEHWRTQFQRVADHLLDTWDHQLTFACWLQNGLAILPNVNLVSNLGFTDDATHTKVNSPVANLPITQIDFPLEHPPFVIRDYEADRYTAHVFGLRRSRLVRFMNGFRAVVGKCLRTAGWKPQLRLPAAETIQS